MAEPTNGRSAPAAKIRKECAISDLVKLHPLRRTGLAAQRVEYLGEDLAARERSQGNRHGRMTNPHMARKQRAFGYEDPVHMGLPTAHQPRAPSDTEARQVDTVPPPGALRRIVRSIQRRAARAAALPESAASSSCDDHGARRSLLVGAPSPQPQPASKNEPPRTARPSRAGTFDPSGPPCRSRPTEGALASSSAWSVW